MQRSKTSYKNRALEGLLCLIGFETIKSLGKYLLRSDHEVQWLVSSLYNRLLLKQKATLLVIRKNERFKPLLDRCHFSDQEVILNF